jgi:tetratricopeptide (TPR) repeat protein
MKQDSKIKFLELNSPLLLKEGLGVVQSLSTNVAIHAYAVNKPVLSGHEDVKTRSKHEVSSYITTHLLETSCPRVIVVKRHTVRIFDYIFSHCFGNQEKYLFTIITSFQNKYSRRFYSLFFLLLFPLLLSAQSSQYFGQQGIVHYELKEFDKAIQTFQQALRFEQATPENYIYLTSSHLLNRSPDLAIESATLGLEEFPESLRLRMMKGEALIQTEIEKAVPLFEGVLMEFVESGRDQTEGISRKDVEAYLSRIYQQVAVSAFDDGKYFEAEEAYKRARVLDPESLSVHNNLAYVLIKQEKWAEADEALNTGLDRFPTSENLLLMMAQVYEQRKENDKMVTILGRLYRTDETNMNRAALYGKALLSANRAEEANNFFLEKIVEYPQERVLYETLLEMNRQRFNQTGVLEVLRLQKEQFPDDEQVLEEYGLELITAQQYAKASTWFDSLAVTKNRPDYAQTAARSWLYEEDFDSAESAYRKHLARWPGDLLLMSDLGIVLKMNGKSDEAAEILKQVLEEKDSPKLRIEYAELLHTYQGKKQVLEPVAGTLYDGWAQWMLLREYPEWMKEEVSTGYVDILSGMVAFYEDRKKLTQAEVEAGLQTFRAPNPPLFQVSSELTKIGLEVKAMMNYLNRKKSHKVAEDVYLKALHTYPDSALLKHYLGMLYYQNNLYEDARIQFEHTARLQPDYEESHLYLGKLYAKSGEFTKAVLSFERVLTLNDRNEDAYRSLVRLHQKQGKLDSLCSRWISRYHHQKENPVLREYLIEALHRANQFEEARALLD